MLRRITTIALLLLFAAPGLGWLFGADQPLSYAEARTLKQTPELEFSVAGLQRYPVDYERYVSDQLGLRRALVASYALLHYHAGFASNARVIVGEDGWLFQRDLGPEGGGLEAPRFGAEGVDAWIASYTARARWLEEHGSHYLLATPPEKHEVFGEHLPARVRARATALGSRMDEVYDRLHRDRPFPFVDLRESLRAAGASERVYPHTDMHWTLAGVEVAQHQIAEAIAEVLPDLQPRRWQDRYRVSDGMSGDLSRMLGLDEWVEDATGFELVDATPFCDPAYTDEETRLNNPNCLSLDPACTHTPVDIPWTTGPQSIAGRAFLVNCPNAPADATIVVFRDSFFSRVQPFFSPNSNEPSTCGAR